MELGDAARDYCLVTPREALQRIETVIHGDRFPDMGFRVDAERPYKRI